jgi:RNA polymerase sigma factor (sigma-70 family)
MEIKPMDDATLLRKYLSGPSQSAFTELVQRHFPFVYRSALRRADGNAALAEEITQTTFILLARKAASLERHPTLAGWLHTTVTFAASDAKREERRRRWHQQEATRMPEISPADEPPPDWSRVQPVIDDALQRLDSRDRDAILLRFFENRPFAEIAARLNLKEDAARMRVNRALARLRDVLGTRGIRSSEAALVALLATEAASGGTIPSALGATVAASAYTAAQSALVGGAAAFHLIQLMATNKTIIATAMIAALVAGLGTGAAMRRIAQGQKAALYSLQTENDKLRDRLTAALLASPKGAETLSRSRAETAGTAAGASAAGDRLGTMNSRIKLRAASRDALPTEVAHPLKFRGYETPINAVESFIWASYHANVEMLARSLYLDDAARAAVDKIRTSLSPELQAQYPTAESLIAMCIAYDAITHPGPNSEDYFVGAPEPNYTDDKNFKTPNGQIYHLTADGWKYSFPARASVFVNAVVNPAKPQ